MTDIQLELALRGQVLVARMDGELDFTNAGDVDAQIRDAMSNNMVALAVDLSRIRYVDSAGVRLLFELASKVQACRQAIGLILAEDSPVRRLVQLTNLNHVAPVYSTVDECVAALSNPVEQRI